MMKEKPDTMHLERNEAVSAFFDRTENYLGFNVVVDIRKEAIAHYSKDTQFKKAIDVACADGSVALSIIDQIGELTLLDLSKNMMNKAAENVQPDFAHKVKLIQGDFLSTELNEKEYDLVICTGLLAHIPDPFVAIAKISGLLKPGGYLFLQNTNDRHFYSCLTRISNRMKAIFRKQAYPLNRISSKKLLEKAEAEGLTMVANYTSIVSFLIFSRWISDTMKRKIIYQLFGHPGEKGRRIRGNDHLYYFKKNLEG